MDLQQILLVALLVEADASLGVAGQLILGFLQLEVVHFAFFCLCVAWSCEGGLGWSFFPDVVG